MPGHQQGPSWLIIYIWVHTEVSLSIKYFKLFSSMELHSPQQLMRSQNILVLQLLKQMSSVIEKCCFMGKIQLGELQGSFITSSFIGCTHNRNEHWTFSRWALQLCWGPVITHYGLVMAYADIIQWLCRQHVAWLHQSITCINLNLSSEWFCGNHLRAFSKEWLVLSGTKNWWPN